VNIPGVLAGNFPPGIWSFTGAVRAVDNLLRTNAAAYDAVRFRDRRDAGGGRSPAEVGLVQNMPAFTPADPTRPEDVAATEHADYLFNRLFVNAAVRGELDADFDQVEDSGERPAGPRKADFLGVNYYFRARVSALGGSLTPRIPVLDFLPAQSYRSGLHPDDPPCPTECSDLGNEIYPRGFRDVLALAGSYGIPVYVTENGIADADDDQRRRFLRDHLRAMHDAIEVDGVREVRGYFHWSLLDNFEWAEGYGPRFGLYSVVPGSPARRARPSARLYARIARANGLPAD
jgi:beta-galactosidase